MSENKQRIIFIKLFSLPSPRRRYASTQDLGLGDLVEKCEEVCVFHPPPPPLNAFPVGFLSEPSPLGGTRSASGRRFLRHGEVPATEEQTMTRPPQHRQHRRRPLAHQHRETRTSKGPALRVGRSPGRVRTLF